MANIKDLAEAAGVSITTVSRALNGYDDVSERTRKKIIRMAEQMGYSPNIAARSLVVKKTKSLGLLLSGITRSGAKDNFAYEVLCGINDRAGELNYDLVMFSTTSSKQKTKSYKKLCQERGVDGVILMGIRLDDVYLQEIVTSSLPCVLVDIPIQGGNVGYITSDNVNGAKRAVNYLIEQGHRKIGMINGHLQADVSIRRLQGYEEALKEEGIPFSPSLVVSGNFTEYGGLEAAIELISEHQDVTAIFCISDLMALGAIQGIKQMGKRVPQDISVIGYDNIFLSGYCYPALTTINQDKYEMGCQAAQILIDMLEGRGTNREIVLPTELIIRDSVRKLS